MRNLVNMLQDSEKRRNAIARIDALSLAQERKSLDGTLAVAKGAK
jgi:hypothetical protein